MSPIRKIAFASACAGLIVSAPMASARSTSGGVPAYSFSAQASGNINISEGTVSDDGKYIFRTGKWHRIKGGKLFLLVGVALVAISGGVILASNNRETGASSEASTVGQSANSR